jgi:MIP family channel proteins
MRRRYLAEFVGTAAITFVPVAWSAAGGQGGIVAAAFASGLTVLAMIGALGPICAAHFNPAVTLGFAAAGRFPWRHVAPYVAAQFLGAVAAAALVRLLFGAGAWGLTVPAAGVGAGRALGMEATLTFLLMLVIMAVATDRRVSAPVPPLAIAAAVIANVLLGGPVTGASMNPARSLGPALLAGDAPTLASWWLYLAGPIFGALLASRLYESGLRMHPEHACGAPADLSAAPVSPLGAGAGG